MTTDSSTPWTAKSLRIALTAGIVASLVVLAPSAPAQECDDGVKPPAHNVLCYGTDFTVNGRDYHVGADCIAWADCTPEA